MLQLNISPLEIIENNLSFLSFSETEGRNMNNDLKTFDGIKYCFILVGTAIGKVNYKKVFLKKI